MNDSKKLLSLEGLVFEAIEIKIDGHALSITLNRPEKRNAINTVMGNEIAYALSYALQEKNIRVVIIQAKGEVFCAGGDLASMSGKVEETTQRETTRFHPRSVYGITKVAGFELTRNYREAYDLFTCTGILFNHESPRRGYEFVTRKISSTAARIKLGLESELRLGNIDAKRDWGFSGEYVRMMQSMLQQNNPDDYVIGTGETHSVREFMQIVFEELKLNYEDYLVVDPRFYRPAEVEILVADPSKARENLGWEPKVTFEELALSMVRSDYENLSND